MGNAERVARQAVEVGAGQRFARRKRNRMDDAVETVPARAEVGEKFGYFFIACDVARQHDVAAEFGRQFQYAVLDAFALVGESESRVFALHRGGDTVGDRAVAEEPGDQYALAGKKSHGRPFLQNNGVIIAD